jgi:PAS domain S-box-containing protein
MIAKRLAASGVVLAFLLLGLGISLSVKSAELTTRLTITLLLTLLVASLAWNWLQAERRADAQDFRYRTILGQAGDAVLVMSLDGMIQEANAQAVAHFGHNLADLRRMSILDLHPPEGRPAAQEMLARIQAGGETGFETVHLRKDGSRLDSEVRARLLQTGGRRELLQVVHDVTERKATQTRLAWNQAFLKAIFDHVPLGICWTNKEGFILEVNRAFADLVGMPPDQLRGMSARHWQRLDDLPRINALRQAFVTRRRGKFSTETRWVVGAGREVWVSLEVLAMGGPDWADYNLGLVQDITYRKETEANLLRQAEEIGIHFRTAPDLLAVFDAEGRFKRVNPAWERVLGHTQEDLIGTSGLALVHPEDLDATLAANERLREEGEVRDFVNRQRHRDGGHRWLEWHIVRWQNASYAAARDITARQAMEQELQRMLKEQRAAQEELEAREHQLSDALHLARAGRWEYDFASDRFTFDDQFYRIFRTTLAEVGTCTLASADYAGRFCHPDDRRVVAEEIRKALETPDPGYSGTLEHRFLYADGAVGDLAVRYTVVKDASGRTVSMHGVNQDITLIKQAERELARRQAELEEFNRSLEFRVQQAVAELRQRDRMISQQSRQAAMGEMLGNIAHQWRQPLSTLSLLLGNLRDAWRFGDLPGEETDALFRRGDALIQNMSETISDFRNFFRTDKDRVIFPVVAQVRRALALVEASFQAAGIDLSLEAGKDVRASGFPSEFSQALLNLLVNARQAIQERGQRGGRVAVTVSEAGGWCRVTVQDNAGGIPDEVIDRIFDPFFTTREQGSGIGLHMTRQIIVDSMQGKVSARNRDGGAELTLLLPLEA